MQTLLDQGAIDELIEIAKARVADHNQTLNAALYATYKDGGSPPGMVNIGEDAEKRHLVQKHVARKADQEERGALPGKLHGQMLRHPAMAEMIEEDLANGAPQ
jgi:hypothetical protein